MESKPYLSIKDACAQTGLSQCFLRSGCKKGILPHIKAGEKYYLNMAELYKVLDLMSKSEDCTNGIY